MQKIREQVLLRRDKVYQENEGEVRNRWNFEDAVSFNESGERKKKPKVLRFSVLSHYQKNEPLICRSSVRTSM